jgi:hypothetical protein
MNIFRNDKIYLSSSAKVINQMSGRTINLSATENGYNFNITEYPEQTGAVTFQNLENASYSNLEQYSIKSGSDISESYSFSVHLHLPSVDSQPSREFIMTGTIEDFGEGGSNLDGNLTNLDGKLVEKVRVEINGADLSPAYRQVITQTSKTIKSFDFKTQKVLFAPTRYASENLFSNAVLNNSLAKRTMHPIVIFIGISVGVAIVAGLTCLYLAAHSGPCATRCMTACASNGGVRSYTQGWCGACSCTCQGVGRTGENCKIVQQ